MERESSKTVRGRTKQRFPNRMDIWGKLSGPVQLDLATDIATKAKIRTKVWDFLEKNDIANFPRPVHNRIPNYKGSSTAGLSVAQLPEFSRAQTVKVNPDKAQEEVRYQVLDHRKTLLVPTPRLTHGLFNKLVNSPEANKAVLRKLASRQGLAESSVPVSLDTHLKIDLVVLGSVAVDRQGHRIGKGEGFADLEFAVAASHHQAVNQDTVVVSTVHDCQVFDSLPEDIFGPHDVPVDIIVTPTQVIRVACRLAKPQKVIWSMITREKFKQIGLLRQIRYKEKLEGIDVALKDENEGIGENMADKTAKKNGEVKANNNVNKIKNGNRTERTKSKIDGEEEGNNKFEYTKQEMENGTGKTFGKLDQTQHEKLDRTKMFGVFIGRMAKSTRVRDLKNALTAKQVVPSQLVWKGHKGIAFVYFEEGGEEIITKLVGLTVKDKLVNVEEVRIIEKERESREGVNNGVITKRRIRSTAKCGKGEDLKFVKDAGDMKTKNQLGEGNEYKVEKYSNKRVRKRVAEKNQVNLKGETIEERVDLDTNVEKKRGKTYQKLEVSEIASKLDSSKSVYTDKFINANLSQVSEAMIEDDASKEMKNTLKDVSGDKNASKLKYDTYKETGTIPKEMLRERETMLNGNASEEVEIREKNESKIKYESYTVAETMPEDVSNENEVTSKGVTFDENECMPKDNASKGRENERRLKIDRENELVHTFIESEAMFKNADNVCKEIEVLSKYTLKEIETRAKDDLSEETFTLNKFETVPIHNASEEETISKEDVPNEKDKVQLGEEMPCSITENKIAAEESSSPPKPKEILHPIPKASTNMVEAKPVEESPKCVTGRSKENLLMKSKLEERSKSVAQKTSGKMEIKSKLVEKCKSEITPKEVPTEGETMLKVIANKEVEPMPKGIEKNEIEIDYESRKETETIPEDMSREKGSMPKSVTFEENETMPNSDATKDRENEIRPNNKSRENKIMLTGSTFKENEAKSIDKDNLCETEVLSKCDALEEIETRAKDDLSKETFAELSSPEKPKEINHIPKALTKMVETKPVNLSANCVTFSRKESLLKKSKFEERSKSETEITNGKMETKSKFVEKCKSDAQKSKEILEFKPKAEEKLKSVTLTEKAKEKCEAKPGVEERPNSVVDEKVESKPKTSEKSNGNDAKSMMDDSKGIHESKSKVEESSKYVTEKSKDYMEHKQKKEEKLKSVTEKLKENLEDKPKVEERPRFVAEKKVRGRSKVLEQPKEKVETKSKEETSKSRGEKSKEKIENTSKNVVEGRPKSATEVPKEKDWNKSKFEDRHKTEGNSRGKVENPASTSLKTLPSKESSFSKSSSESFKKSSPNDGTAASNAPGSNPDSPKVPFDSDKDPDKCLIS